jgi:putative endonuclease
MKQPAVHIITHEKNGTLYIGVTSNLLQRMYQHKQGLIKGFTQKYKCTQLVYYEIYETILSAIEREKQLKAKNRKAKIELINNYNFFWDDLSEKF